MNCKSDPGKIERRAFKIDEMRIDGPADNPRIVGHAALFDTLSEDLGGFREKIAKGAFSKAVTGDVRALFNHDPNIVLGRTKAKTLTLSEDQRGLAIDVTPPDTEAARAVMEAIRRGDVSQMSFGFRTLKDQWDQTDSKDVIRTLLDVELFDVSPVTFPAYPTTEVALRAMAEWRSLAGGEPAPGEDGTPGDPDADEDGDEGGDEGRDAAANIAQMRQRQLTAELT